MVDAVVATDRPNSFIVIRLYDVLPDGSWLFINRGVQSLRHAAGVDSPGVVVPVVPFHVIAAMQPNDYVFQVGHKIGLTITSSDSSYILPSGTTARNTLSYGAGQSKLILPTTTAEPDEVLYKGLSTWGIQQPGWMGPHHKEET
jgi:predicted acyl esterase